MITTVLMLRYGPHALRKTEAWYVPVGDPAAWIDEIACWDVPHAAVCLLPVSHSPSNRQPRGALLIVPDGTTPKPTPRCVPFGKMTDRLFLPVNGWLDPDVSETELRSLLSDAYTYVWHPASGLVAFEPDDVLAATDLLAVGAASARRWTHARPGVALSQRLVSLMPEETLTIEMILEAGQGDIGTEKDVLSELPPSPLEPKSGVMSGISRHSTRLLASAVRWVTQRVPATATSPTWIDHLEQWAEKHLAAFRAGLDASRHKEIARLMHLLQTDPDRGLRFALPIGGDAHRGLAPPSNRLAERILDFNLGGFGGGTPADLWDIHPAYQYQLITRYRELANRELRLGRHRRAAYIFAELLADFHAAAGALVAGGHWREAAVLYAKRLNRPLDAARCLEQGGLWMEAVAYYEELKEHERAGDLYGKLDQPDQSREQYRKAVNKHRANGDLLASARLLETKLHAADEAIGELSTGWPHSRQAGPCLRGLFRLLGQFGYHDAAGEWMAGFRERPAPLAQRIELVDILADMAKTYPDRTVQAQAADCTRALVSRQLSMATQAECRQLLSAVGRLVPEDRLLGRDCRRYLQQKPVAPRTSSPKRESSRKRPVLVRTIQLPGNGISWKQAVSSGKTIYVAGQCDDQLILVRCSWTEVDRPGKIWKVEPRFSAAPVILAVAPWNDTFVLLHVVGAMPLTTEHEFPPSAESHAATKAGAMCGMSHGVLAAARTSHGVTWLLEPRAGLLTLVALGASGEHLSTQTVPTSAPVWSFDGDLGALPVPLHARSDRVYLGAGNQMLIFDKAKPPETVEFAGSITSLAGSAPHTLPRIAATFAQGVTVFWDDFDGGHTEAVAPEMPCPVAGFNRGGYLIAATDGSSEVYGTQGSRAKLVAELSNADPRPIAVLSGPRADQFGIVSETGHIAVYELP